MAKKKIYAVAKGSKIGIYDNWEETEKQIHGVSALHKSFDSMSDAASYMREHGITKIPFYKGHSTTPSMYLEHLTPVQPKQDSEDKAKVDVLDAEHCFNVTDKDTFTIEYVVDKVIYSNPDTNYYIFSLKRIKLPEGESLRSPSPVAKGEFAQEVRTGDHYKSLVKWVQQGQYGWQFDCLLSFPLAPANIRGIKRFLRRFIPGVGTKTVEAIVEVFGVNTIPKLKEGVETISTIDGIGKKKAEKIYQKIIENDCIEELSEYLFMRGIRNFMTVVKIYEQLGNSAVSMIRANPYILVEKINSSLLPISEQIAMENDLDFYDLSRIECILMTYINGKTFLHGDTYIEFKTIMQDFGKYVLKRGSYSSDCFNAERLGFAVKDALVSLRDQKRIVLSKIDGVNVVYPYVLHQSEVFSASGVISIMNAKEQELATTSSIDAFLKKFESEQSIKIDEMQKQAIYQSLTSRISIITGGPGTGKTMTVNIFIQALTYIKPNIEICLAAPTGRAAKRMTELAGMPALTIHRLLGLNNREEVDIKNLELKQSCDVLIVDEFSMADILLFSKLMSAVKKEKVWMVIVGDVDQLPSVGPGMVLRDLIDSNIIPVTRLSTLFRQAEMSQIATTAHAINDGLLFGDGIEIDTKRGDFYFFQANTEQDFKEIALGTIKHLCKKGVSANDITLLSPMRKGFVGTEQLNPLIRDILNPSQENKMELRFDSLSFRIGDRVMQMVNNYDLGIEGVFNGEIGVVTYIDTKKRTLIVRFQDADGEDMDVEYKGTSIFDLELAYAVTVHKAQGSEMPIIIMPTIWYNNYNKNLLYTGLTRAREQVILIGNINEANRIIQTEGVHRLSGLKNKLLTSSKDSSISE